MSNQRTHALLIRLEETLSSRCGEVHRLARLHEIFVRDDTIIDATQHGGFRDERSELLHQIQTQRGPPEAWLMVKSQIRIKTNCERGQRAIFRQHTISQ